MYKKALVLAFAMSLVVSACGPGQFFGPTLTPTPTITFTPTVTFTPLPPTETFTPVPVVTQAITPATQPVTSQSIVPVSGQPVLVEQFMDNGRGWSTLFPHGRVLVEEGQFSMRGTDEEQPAAAYCSGDCGPYTDNFYYQSEVLEAEVSSLGIGIVFGMDVNNQTFYAYKIRPSTGEYALVRRANGVYQDLLPWTSATAMNAYPQINTIGVSITGGNIDLYLNGAKIGFYVLTSPISAGRIGFYVDPGGEGMVANSASVFTQQQAQAPLATNTLLPRATQAVTATPTAVGSCPPSIPSGTFALIITKTDPGKKDITINGSPAVLELGINPFYLPLGQNNVVQFNGKVKEYYFEVCKIVYEKVK